MVVLKDHDLPSVNEEFDALVNLQKENRFHERTGQNPEVNQAFRWVEGISYVDSNCQEHRLSVVECRETKLDHQGKEKTTKFKWVTNCKVSADNVTTLANDGGRIRWKIENEGFNVQKNDGYEMEHPYSEHPNAFRVFYILLLIAHYITQLILHGSLIRSLAKSFASAKNFARRLAESLRNHLLPENLPLPAQIRFQPP
jgi:hypothetical protein